MIVFACPNPDCRRQYRVHEDKAGKTTTCLSPRCGWKIRVPNPLPKPEPVAGELIDEETGAALKDWRTELLEPIALATVSCEVLHDEDEQDNNPPQPFTIGMALGAASLVVDGMAFLTLVLPCFWFLALPMSGLGSGLGVIGLVVAIKDSQRGLVMSIIGTILGVLMLLISALLVFYAQVRLNQSLDLLRRL